MSWRTCWNTNAGSSQQRVNVLAVRICPARFPGPSFPRAQPRKRPFPFPLVWRNGPFVSWAAILRAQIEPAHPTPNKRADPGHPCGRKYKFRRLHKSVQVRRLFPGVQSLPLVYVSSPSDTSSPLMSATTEKWWSLSHLTFVQATPPVLGLSALFGNLYHNFMIVFICLP